jgi:protease-4
VTTLRQIVFNLFFLSLVFLFIVILFSSMVKSVPKGVALRFAPTGKIVEQSAEPLLVDRLFDVSTGVETVLSDIIDTIDHARIDKNIRALVLELEHLDHVGISQLQEIGAALSRFKNSGKTVIASGTSFDQQQYYLAAHADQLYLHPMGQIWLSGFGVYRTYIKRALDKLQVDFHIFKKGTYKSALEPFLRNDMSPADRESNAAWLTAFWDTYTSEIAALRGIPANLINDYINNIDLNLKAVDGDAARMALNFGLVDGLKTRDKVQDELIELVGEEEDTGSFDNVQFENYAEIALPRIRRIRPDQNHVAIIVAEGIIMDGTQPAGRIGADSISALIRQVRDDEQVKAVVLRINSGGGSAVASEIIRRELELTRINGKPVVVSMSSVAASGAYWISVAADEIWATPTTITGSIGIFAALPTFDRSLDTIGITTDGVGTTRLSGAFDLTRPLNPLLSEALEIGILRGYRRFIDQVASGRHMSSEDVEKVAQGRVWAAAAARDLGLIDNLGGLAEAVKSAAVLAKLDSYNVVYVEKPITARERLLRKIKRMVIRPAAESIRRLEISGMPRILPGLYDRESNAIFQLNDPGHVYALCLSCIAFGD